MDVQVLLSPLDVAIGNFQLLRQFILTHNGFIHHGNQLHCYNFWYSKGLRYALVCVQAIETNITVASLIAKDLAM